MLRPAAPTQNSAASYAVNLAAEFSGVFADSLPQ